MAEYKPTGADPVYRKYLADRHAVLGPDNERWLKDDPVLWDCILEPAGPPPKRLLFLTRQEKDAWSDKHSQVYRAKQMGYPDIQFYGHVKKAIRWTWSRIQLSDPPPICRGLVKHWVLNAYVEYFRWLLAVRDGMRSGKDERDGINNVVVDLFRSDSFTGEEGPFNDEEDAPAKDQYYYLVRAISERFFRQGVFNLGTLPPEPEVEEAIAQFRAWEAGHQRKKIEQENAERAANAKQARARGYKEMPHNPDLQSLLAPYQWAVKQRTENDTEAKLADARSARDPAFFDGLATACAIEGFVGYWINNPLPEVRSRLYRSCDHMKQALDFGAQLHAWQISDQIHKAIAVNHHSLVTTVSQMKQEEWDTKKIKPVNWLVTRIRLVIDMYNNRENDLAVLLENERKWIFEEKLPAELETELPEMRNFYEMLRALAMRDDAGFNKALNERTAVRAKYFDNNIAPIALLDVHGLALGRLARKRGLKPQASHVYLPLDILDLGN